MKICIINGNYEYTNLFKSLGHEVVGIGGSPDLVVFTGGADVTPALYGDHKHQQTFNQPDRDEQEGNVFDFCRYHAIPMVGICRGAQFLNVKSGGRMYQHVEKHAVYAGHSITDVESGEVVHVSSTHHQMMMPGAGAVLVATAALGGSREWYDGQHFKRDVSKEDIEVVFYPETKCLCFQPHPEFDYPEYEGMKDYFRRLLNKYLGVE